MKVRLRRNFLLQAKQLLDNNNNKMRDKAEKSRENLSELEKCSEEMSKKMVVADDISNKLLEESTSSEARLNHLVEVSDR